ncbi:MAG: hypothetical protein ACYTDW_07650 [Planctomycetota bacterium]
MNSYGVIYYVDQATCKDKVRGKMVYVDCTRVTGIDADHNDIGAITVHLMPHEKTP